MFYDFQIFAFKQLYLREENCYTNSGLEQRNTEESCLRLFEKVGSLMTTTAVKSLMLLIGREGK